ncbi:MAG: hypothetical protein KA505_02100 [Xanthomonadales bacterium]|jgi:hypothetical protein|nr:hypothetical protein [Xanthomonadales bacterium]MBP6077587.1 hypothetical protein [Xanthomonadales bacterium]MBP7624611.1 hypothetical protein [Xanthomonadales bacterium]
MSQSICPFCAWAVAGLLLAVSAPDLLGARTPVGPALLWLVAIPFASAMIRRGLRAAST